jgi:hypothetical protein
MKKRVGLALASLAAICLIGAGSYAVACGGTCSSKSAKKASNKTTTSAVTAVNASANTSCDAAKASNAKTCTAAEKAACEAAGYTCTTKAKNAEYTSGKSCTSKAKSAEYASSKSCDASKASMTSASCAASCASKSKNASMASSKSCDASKASASCSATCGSKDAKKAYYAANVYKVENGMRYAVADGKKFVVTKDTPYTQVGKARYYFADDHCSVKCQEKMSSMASKYNHEAVVLASNEGNVKIVDGKKMAHCCGHDFAVDSSTPALVMDGQKVYFCNDKCCDNAMAMNVN